MSSAERFPLAFVKLVVICFFFFPWAAIKLVLRKRLA